MTSSPGQPVGTGTAIINGKAIDEVLGLQFDGLGSEIILPGRARIRIYAFTSPMFAIKSKRIGTEEYVLDGPKLGHYNDTADVREGPYVNHFINHLEISIAYLGHEAHLHIRGRADLSKSPFDPYWYKGPTTGEWTFDVSLVHKIA